MHDPSTVAFDIKRPWPITFRRPDPFAPKRNTLEDFSQRYRPTWITIWHEDPERDGTDDSCGWFPRARHGDKRVLAAIRREFAFHWTWGSSNQGWFDASTGMPQRSALAITLDMFYVAARVYYRGRLGDEHGWWRAGRFMRRNLFELMHLAEGGSGGGLRSSILMQYGMQYGEVPRDERIEEFASIVYGWILRAERPWYRHPKWHVRHWRIQIHPTQQFKRWAFSRCATCGGRFRFGESPISTSWGGDGPRWFRGERGVHHMRCSGGGPVSEAQEAKNGQCESKGA